MLTTASGASGTRKYGHIYIRVSSGEQAETGNSIENQRSECRAYAARHNIIIHDVYIDAGISGRSMKRPELLRLQAAVQNGEHVIAFSVSRLSRSVKDFIVLVEWAEQHNLTLHTVKEVLDTKSAYGSFMIILLAGFGQLEANLTQERMAELNTRKLRRGETTKAPPFGYRSVKYSVGIPARLVPDPVEQGAISRMFALRWQEQFRQMPLRAIAETITREGHKPRRSEAFTVESIRQIMSREYEFRMRVHGTLTIPDIVIQRYVDLCMPFIVPMKVMEDFITVGKDGRATYNGQYEDSSVVTERIHFFTARKAGASTGSGRGGKRGAPKIATALDLHLMLYDRQQEMEQHFLHMADQEMIARRSIADQEAKDQRRILEQIITSQMRLEATMSGLRTTLIEDLKMAEVRYRLKVEENREKIGYNEMDDSEALELRINVMQLKRKIAQYQSAPTGISGKLNGLRCAK